MSARAIVSGALGKPAEIRTSKNGNTFATCSLRESLNGSTRWWQGITFNESVIEILKEMAVGEPIAVAGEIAAEIYAPAGHRVADQLAHHSRRCPDSAQAA